MKLTNKKNLPSQLFRAIQNDPYTKGESDYSVTGLLKPPRAAALELKHFDEIEEDISSRTFALLGQAVHVILERAANPNDLVEKRFFSEFNGVKVSGQIDYYDCETKTLSDWKVTKAWAFSKKGGSGKKPEWIQQLNMQAHLIRLHGINAEKLQIVGILKDFDQKKAGENGYPDAEIVVADIPLWDAQACQEFILERIKLHEAAKSELPKCSGGETWGGNRCKGYCLAAPFCEQYKSALKTGLL